MATTAHITTAEQLVRASGLGRCELVRGELMMMSPAGAEHGNVVGNVTISLGAFVKARRLGEIFGAETGFQIGHDPDTVRAPDVAFVRSERLGKRLSKGFFQGAPDLAVEVVSPTDRPVEVLAKVHDWLDAGCRAVWVIDPGPRTVAVYRSRSQGMTLGTAGELSGEEVVPGFRVPVAEIFGE